jgi:phage terminase small subunit
MLTIKQEAFASAIANGKTQADAYRSAYNAENMKESTLWSNASRLMADSKVAARVEDLRKQLENKQLWTREMSVKALIGAYKEGNPTAKIAAVKELNAMHGFNAPTKLDVINRTLEPLKDDDWL